MEKLWSAAPLSIRKKVNEPAINRRGGWVIIISIIERVIITIIITIIIITIITTIIIIIIIIKTMVCTSQYMKRRG